MELNYKKYGNKGQCIIILHGLLGSLDNWQTIAKILSEQYQIYSIDQRNHGRSPHSDILNYDVLAEDLNNFIHQHQLENIVLLGHSMGGKVAMLYSLLYPEKVSKLIVVDITPRNYSGGHELILETMKTVDLKSITSRKTLEDFFMEQLKSLSLVQFVTKNLGRNSDNTFYWKCNLEAIVNNYKLLMSFPQIQNKFSGKTYFIKGELSDYIQKDDNNIIQQYFPNSKTFEIKNATHWVHADNTEDFINTIHYILDEHE